MATLARSFSLAEEQRQQLFALVRCGKTSARAITRAHVLLQCGKGEDAGIIARRIGLCANTVHDILRRYETGGLECALFDRPRPGQPRRFTMQQIQQITALACQKPPLGYAHWTLDLLKEEIIKQNIAPTISRYTITNILHHHDLRPWREKNVVR
jgi:transposase